MITAASYIYSVWSISHLALIQGKKGRLTHRMPCSGDIKAKTLPLTTPQILPLLFPLLFPSRL